MNWKQPNYGVFYRTFCGYENESKEPSKSIKSSIKFCKSYDLLGLVCDARPFIACPELIKTVKQSGLLFATFGTSCSEECELLVQNGVDAIIQDDVFRYKNDELSS
jgi:glycerophosphoryl diester phosphodiesterase